MTESCARRPASDLSDVVDEKACAIRADEVEISKRLNDEPRGYVDAIVAIAAVVVEDAVSPGAVDEDPHGYIHLPRGEGTISSRRAIRVDAQRGACASRRGDRA